MPSLLANTLLGLLGAGTVTTAVAVPMSLSSKSSAKSEVTVSQTNSETHKSHSEWKEPNDFHKYCYGDFLKEKAKGELLVCLDQSSEETKSSPLFYLRWKEQDTENFWPINRIVVGTSEGVNWEVSFYAVGQARKVLTVKKEDHKDLSALQSNSLKELQDTCKNSKLNGEDYQLTCIFKAGYTVEETYTKLAKKKWFEGR